MSQRNFLPILVTLLGLSLLAPTVLSASVSIGYDAETGDPISYETSTWSLTFRWMMENATTPEYQIGNSITPSKYVDWTAMAYPAGRNWITTPSELGIFYSEIVTGLALDPEDNVIVNIRSTGESQSATSLSVQVGSAQRFCDAFWDPEPSFGTTVLPPQPNVTAVWDADTQKMVFTVDSFYLQWGRLWYIDFNTFTTSSANGVNGFAYGSCENRANADLAGREFGEYFNAAPTATNASNTELSPLPLDNPNYLAYQHSSSVWSVSALDCSRVRYTASFLPTELSSCSDGGAGSPISVTTTGSNIVYSGTLYVEAVTPQDFNNAAAGFQTTQFQYPFQFTFNVQATQITGANTSQTLAFTFDKIYLSDSATVGQYNLAMQVSTDTLDPLYGLSAASVSSQPAGVDLGFTNSPTPAETQTWTLETATGKAPGGSFDGTYQFQWTRSLLSDGSDPTTETISIQVNMDVVQVIIDAATLVIDLAYYNDNSFAGSVLVAPVYTRDDTIYIRSLVRTVDGSANEVDLPASQNNQFKNQIWNVWVCYTVDDSVPSSCQTETTVVRPLGQVVASGVSVTSGEPGKFGAVTFTSRPDLIHAGLSVQASAFLGRRAGAFFVEIESRITDPNSSRKRSVFTVNAVSGFEQTRTGLNGFTIQVAAQSDPGQSFASTLSPVSLGYLVAIVAALILVWF